MLFTAHIIAAALGLLSISASATRCALSITSLTPFAGTNGQYGVTVAGKRTGTCSYPTYNMWPQTDGARSGSGSWSTLPFNTSGDYPAGDYYVSISAAGKIRSKSVYVTLGP